MAPVEFTIDRDGLALDASDPAGTHRITTKLALPQRVNGYSPTFGAFTYRHGVLDGIVLTGEHSADRVHRIAHYRSKPRWLDPSHGCVPDWVVSLATAVTLTHNEAIIACAAEAITAAIGDVALPSALCAARRLAVRGELSGLLYVSESPPRRPREPAPSVPAASHSATESETRSMRLRRQR